MQQQQIMQISNILFETNNRVTAMQRDMFRRQQEAQDRMHEGFIRVIRGVESYRTPFSDQPVDLPMGYSHAWTNINGEFILTNSENFNPKQISNKGWQRIEKKR
jgi:hypothetical protein